MTAFLTDLCYAARSLRKNPSFTAVAVLSLALGVGANTAIFSVVNAVLLRPLSYRDPGRLALLFETNPKLAALITDIPASAPVFLEWRRRSRSFETLAAVAAAPFNVTAPGEPERVQGARVSAGLFPLLGVPPLLGRTFTDQEDQYGRNDVVVLGYRLWQRRFSSDAGAIGRKMVVEGVAHTIVGVMPEGFGFPRGPEFPAYFHLPARTELWRPLGLSPAEAQHRGNHNYVVIGRLRGSVPPQQAQAELSAIERRLMGGASQELHRSWSARLVPFHEQVVRGSRTVLLVLLAAVGALLLICCANVAHLLLARADRRRREIAVRAALGAGRARLVCQLLTESLLLALGGGAAGLLLAKGLLRGLSRLGADLLPRWEEVSLDPTVLGFTLAVSLLSAVLFSLIPALGSLRLSLTAALRGGSRTATAGSQRGRNALVVAEMALSLVLLVVAGLMIRSFAGLLSQPTGLRPQGIVTMQVSLSAPRYPRGPRRAAFYDEALARIAGVPGVGAAALLSALPLSGDADNSTSTVEGRPPARPEDSPVVQYRAASPEIFRALGIPLLRGRNFSARDGAGTPQVAVINQSMARRFWPGEEAIGKRFKRGHQPDTPWVTVVGVAGDVRHEDLGREPLPQAYLPYWQANPGEVSFVVRLQAVSGAPDPLGLVPAVRAQIWSVDPSLPVNRIKTMDQLIADSVAQPRMRALLLGLFAAVALALAAVGAYGVISYSAAQRTREIGIRMALGAQRADALRLVLRQGMALALAGAALGLLLALGAARALASLLFGVTAADPVTLAAAALLLLAVAFTATWFPAWRATRIDPITALHYE